MMLIRSQAFQKWLSSRMAIYFASALFVFAIMGLRDIIITGLIRKIIRSQALLALLDGVYWLSLSLSLLLIAGYVYVNRAQMFETLKARARYVGYGLAGLIFVSPFFYLTITKRFFLDYWLDEVMSLYRHIVPSISSSLFWYPAPNNHIFSNAITGIYLQLLGHPDMLEIVQNPWLLRIFYLGFGIGTILLLSITGYRFLDHWAGWIAVILFCTTIPYLNFVVQVRGYSPSIFFAVALLFFILNYRESHQRRDAFFVAAFSAMLFYTIPSNLYILIGWVVFFAIVGGIPFLKQPDLKSIRYSRNDFIILNQDITLGGMIVAGILLSSLLYLPVLPQVMGNKFVETNGFLRGTALPNGLIYVLQLFISNRMVIFSIAGLGVISGWVAAGKRKDERLLFLFQLNTAGFLFPFVISFIRGDQPYERIFLVNLPSFIFLAVLGFHHWLTQFSTRSFGRFIPMVFLAVLLIYANLVFFNTYREIEQRIYSNLVEEKAIQVEVYDDTLWASHHLDHYYLNSVIAAFLTEYDGKTPVLIDANDTRFPWVIGIFLEANGIPFAEIETVPDASLSEAYVFLSFPNRSLTELTPYFPDAKCTQLSLDVSVYRVMRCQLRAQP